jgi:hypothetical protein
MALESLLSVFKEQPKQVLARRNENYAILSYWGEEDKKHTNCGKSNRGDSVCLRDGNKCVFFVGVPKEYSDTVGDIYVLCSNPLSIGYKTKEKDDSGQDIQSIAYRIFDLIEPAIKAAIAQALSEQLESSE